MTAAAPKYSSERVSQIQEILQKLRACIKANNIADSACDTLLPKFSDLIKLTSSDDLASSFERSGITTLGHYAFDGVSLETRRTALRCLHNVLVLAIPARQIFVDKNLPEKAIELMKNSNVDDELFTARMLLLCSSHTTLDLLPCFEHKDLAKTIKANISRHARTAGVVPATSALACDASLNLLSTLAIQYKAQAYRFLDSVRPILDMFDRMSIPSPPLEPPLSRLIAFLVTIPFYDKSRAAERVFSPPLNEEKLIKILDLAVRAYQHEDLNTYVTPLVALLLLITQSAPANIKARLRASLLPSDQDRATALDRGNSLPRLLVRISTEAATQQLKGALSNLLFELSDKDPERLLQNVGFGCGSGLLYSLGMPVPQGLFDPAEREIAGGHSEVNPITGQRLDMEPQQSLEEMTWEEKKREAERLFVLFERLNATGMMKVENPLRAAAGSSRIEELDKSDEDGVDN